MQNVFFNNLYVFFPVFCFKRLCNLILEMFLSHAETNFPQSGLPASVKRGSRSSSTKELTTGIKVCPAIYHHLHLSLCG